MHRTGADMAIPSPRSSPRSMPSRLWLYFSVSAYFVGLSFMWNSLHLLILPTVLLHWAPEGQKNTYL